MGDTARTLAWDALPRAGAGAAAAAAVEGYGGDSGAGSAPPAPTAFGEWSSSEEEDSDDAAAAAADGDDDDERKPRGYHRSRSPLPLSSSSRPPPPPPPPPSHPPKPRALNPPLRALTVRECEGSLGEAALRHLPPQLTSLALEAAGAPDGGGGLLRSGRPFLDGFCPALLSLTRLRDLSLASRGVGSIP